MRSDSVVSDELDEIKTNLPRCSSKSSDEVVTDSELEYVLDILAKLLDDPQERESPRLLVDINSKRFRKFRKAITRVRLVYF